MTTFDINNLPLATANKVLNRVIGTQVGEDGGSTVVLYPIKNLSITGGRIVKITTSQGSTDGNGNYQFNLTVYLDDGSNYSSLFSIPPGPQGLSVSRVDVKQDDVTAGEVSGATLNFYAENNEKISSVDIKLPPGVNSAAVDKVSADQETVSPGKASKVTVTTTYMDGSVKTFSFNSPPGTVGATGPMGKTGPQGSPGKDSQSIKDISVEQTAPTVGENTKITLTQTFNDDSSQVYSYIIPPGNMGMTGPQGPRGQQGPQGPAGPPGDSNNEGITSIVSSNNVNKQLAISNLVSSYETTTSESRKNTGIVYENENGYFSVPNESSMEAYVQTNIANKIINDNDVDNDYRITSLSITKDAGNNAPIHYPCDFLKIDFKSADGVTNNIKQTIPTMRYIESNFGNNINAINDSGLIISSLSLTDSGGNSSSSDPQRNFLIIHYRDPNVENSSYYQTVPTKNYLDSTLGGKISTYANSSSDVKLRGIFKNSSGKLQIDFDDGTWAVITL